MFGIVAGVACFLSMREHRASVWDVSAGASALGTTIYVAYYSVAVGVSALIVIGWGIGFLLGLPWAFGSALLCRLASRRPLRAFRSADEAERREQKRHDEAQVEAAHAGSAAESWWRRLVG